MWSSKPVQLDHITVLTRFLQAILAMDHQLMTCCFPWPIGLAVLMLRYRRPIQLARRLTSPAGLVAIHPSALWQSAQAY